MNLSRLRDVLENHKGLVLAGAAMLILSIWVLVPEQPNPEKLQGLLERGNYPAVREGAQQALARDPESHEIRVLLIEACLGEGRFTEAMEHLLFLNSSGWDTKELELVFFRQISAIAGDYEESGALLAHLAERLSEHAGWDWLKAFGLQVLEAGGDITKAPAYLAQLNPEDVEKITYLLKPVWRTAAESGDWDAAWQTAGVLDPLLKAAEDAAHKREDYEAAHRIRVVADLDIDISQAWHVRVISDPYDNFGQMQSTIYPGYMCRLGFLQSNFGGDEEKWAALQEKYPEDPLLACARGRGNLDWLADWESRHSIVEGIHFYSSLKAQLIARAGSLAARHFTNILPWDLLDAALSNANNKAKLAEALDHLKAYPGMTGVVETARLALDAPDPAWTLENYPLAILSGDGNGLILTELGQGLPYEITVKYRSLETGDDIILPEGDLSWSPDASRYVAQVWDENKYKFRVYTKQGELVQEVLGSYNQETIQWRDSTSLWVVKRELKPEGNVICLYILDLRDGSIYRADSVPYIPQDSFFSLRFGPRGRLAWVEGQELKVYDGAKTFTLTYQGEHCLVMGWRPDGRGMLVYTDGHTYYYRVGGSLDKLNCELNNCTWLSNSEFAGEYSLSSGQKMLGIYDLKTGKTTLTGIVNPIDVVGSRVLTRGVDALYIYELDDLRTGE